MLRIRLTLFAITVFSFSCFADDSDVVKKYNFHLPLNEAIMEIFLQNPPNFEEFEKLFLRVEGGAEKLQTIACYAAKHHPRKAFEIFNARYFSSLDRMIPMCRELDIRILVPELKKYDHKLEEISGFRSERGTMVYGFYASVTAQNILNATYPVYGKEYEDAIDENGKFDFDDGFLEYWKSGGVWEHELYEKTMQAKEKVRPILENYYKKQFGLSDKSSSQSANYALESMKSAYLRISEKNKFESAIELLDERLEIDKDKSFVWTVNDKLANFLLTAIVESYPQEILDKIVGSINLPIEDVTLFEESFHQAAAHHDQTLKLLHQKLPFLTNTQNRFGKTALMYAAQYNNLEAAKYLIENGADANLATYAKKSEDFYYFEFDLVAYERTPLMYAAWHAGVEMIKYIAANCNKTVTDSKGNIAAQYLVLNDRLSPEEFLELFEMLKGDYYKLDT